jgi:hypothetical protein
VDLGIGGLVPIYQNRIIFAKDLSNKIFSPPRHQDTKLNHSKQFFFVSLCLCGFVAILSGLSGLGIIILGTLGTYDVKSK